jgi:Ammonium Transporter Family
MLGAALVFILVTIGWVLGHMIPFFAVMKAAGILRVKESEEMVGLDVSHHGGAAYRDVSRHGNDLGGSDGMHKGEVKPGKAAAAATLQVRQTCTCR